MWVWLLLETCELKIKNKNKWELCSSLRLRNSEILLDRPWGEEYSLIKPSFYILEITRDFKHNAQLHHGRDPAFSTPYTHLMRALEVVSSLESI